MNVQAAGWFYHADNDRKGPFSSEQMSALLTAGAITEHTKVWSEGLAEWTPLFRTELRALLGGKPVAPPEIEPANANVTFVQADPIPAAPSPSHVAYSTYDNRTLATITRWASLLCAGFSIMPVVQMVKKKTIEEQYALFKFQETDAAAIVFGVPMLITMVLFLFWKYRATANLFNVAGRQTITPAGAVYWYFVPVLWFWRPYEGLLTQGAGKGPVMGEDGKRLFHGDHGNVTTGWNVTSSGWLSAGRLAMRRMKSLDGKTPLSVSPKFILARPEDETTIEQHIAAIYATQPADVNVFAGRYELLVEPRLSANAAYLFADPAAFPVLEYAYLSSAPGPQIASQPGWDRLGMEFRVFLDFGAGAIDFRGAHRFEA